MADEYSSPYFRGAQIPESVRSQIMAAQLLQQSAAQASQPYTSKGVNVLKGFSGLLGGLMEGSAIHGEAAAQAAHRTALATLLATPQAGSPGATGGAGPGTVGMSGAPAAGTPISAAPQSTDARDLAIRTIYGEAGGEPAQGQAGVASVLKNRLASGQYGNDMSSVITAPKQFSLWNQGDPAGDTARKLDPNSPAYQRIGSIYDGVMSGQIADPTGGATHYYNPSAASPAWGPQLAKQNDVTIGNHRFVGTGSPGPGGTAAASMPAPNAQPVASNTLPPGVTADMIGGSSPYGGPPKPMSSIVTAAMAKAGMDTTGLPGAATPSPFGALQPTPQPSTPAPAAPVSANPFGAGPKPMGQQQLSPQQSAVMAAMLAAPQPNPSAPQPNPDATSDSSDTPARPQVALSSGADPATITPEQSNGATPIMPDGSAGPSPLLASQADPGASGMLPADPPLPPPNPQSPFGGAPQPMAPPPAVPPAAMAAALRGGQSPMSAAPLSTDSIPGFDSFNAAGGVQQSSLGAAGFTGRDNAQNPITAATQGGLPAPQSYVGGDLGLGTPPAPPGPSVAAAGPSVPASGSSVVPAGPLPQMAAGNLPAPNMALVQALRDGAPSAGPSSAPSTGAASPQAGPASTPQPAPNPDAPAPGAIPAGPAPLPPAVMAAALLQGAPQPLGLAGHSAASDPMSPQSFNRHSMVQALAQGAPGVAAPSGSQSSPNGSGSNPLASLPLVGGMFGGQSGPQASAGGQQGASTPYAPQTSGGGFLSSLLGGSQPQAASTAGLSPQQQAYMSVLSDPRTTPQEAQMIMQRFGPQPIEKGTPGEHFFQRQADGSLKDVASVPALDKYKGMPDGLSVLDSSTGVTKADPNAFRTVEVDAGNGVKLQMAIGRNPDGTFHTQLITPNGAGASGAASPPPPVAPITFGGQSTAAPLTVQGTGPNAAPVTTGLGPQVDNLVAKAGALQAAQAGAKAGAEANAKNDVDEVAASRTKLEGLRQSGQDLSQAQAALDSYRGKMPTGPFGQNALWARGIANTVGLGDPSQLSNMEIFAKNATKVASQQIKEFTSKGTNLDLETELKNNPGVSVSDQTNRILIDHMGRANTVAQQYENAKQSYYDQNGSLKGFQPQWEQSISGAGAVPLSKYPLATKMVGGQTYQKVLSTDPSGYTWTTGGVQ